jgi:hypothetical protein
MAFLAMAIGFRPDRVALVTSAGATRSLTGMFPGQYGTVSGAWLGFGRSVTHEPWFGATSSSPGPAIRGPETCSLTIGSLRLGRAGPGKDQS